MRYAIVSDIHANLQAWNAVLLDIRSNAVDKIVALGDLVGYGPSPAEVLQSVHANVNHLVLGNHDAVICGKMDAALFNDEARHIIHWTRRQLNANALAFLKTLPLTLAAPGFRCAHAEFSQPAAFNYVIDPEDALASWQTVTEPLLFVGHTHTPAIYLIGASGTPHLVPPQDFQLEDGKRYLVNVGSVGHPRDGEIRSSYCIHDTAARTVTWRRLPFDLDAYRDALRRAGLPEAGSHFLSDDPRVRRRPLREQLSFSPARNTQEAARDTVPVQAIEALQRRAVRWQRAALGTAALAIVLGGAAGAFAWYRHTRHAVIAPANLAAVDAARQPAGANLLRLPAAATAPGQPVAGWRIELGDKRRQAAWYTPDAAEPETGVLHLRSLTAAHPAYLGTPAIRVDPRSRLTFEALFKRDAAFQGVALCSLDVVCNAGGVTRTVEDFANKEPNEKRKDDWWLARRTLELPADATAVHFRLGGRFAGEVAIKGLKLTIRPAGGTEPAVPSPPR